MGCIVLLIIIIGFVVQKTNKQNNNLPMTIPEMEIEQSSDDRKKKPVTVNTNGKVNVAELSNYNEDKTMNEEIQNNQIKISSIGSYSGAYVEDGSDEKVEDILAIVITNTSKEFLQYSQITLSNGKDKAVFSVSNLPAGSSALVLSKDKIKAKGNWKYLDDMTAFIDEASLYPKIFSWEAGNNMVRMTNKSDEDFKNVYVYYKNVENGIYVGGITYRVKFDNLKAKQTAQKLSKHFSGKQSQIMMIDYLKE